MSGTRYNKDPAKCACRYWAESPQIGYREEGLHHPRCPAGHEKGCECHLCRWERGERDLPWQVVAAKVRRLARRCTREGVGMTREINDVLTEIDDVCTKVVTLADRLKFLVYAVDNNAREQKLRLISNQNITRLLIAMMPLITDIDENGPSCLKNGTISREGYDALCWELHRIWLPATIDGLEWGTWTDQSKSALGSILNDYRDWKSGPPVKLRPKDETFND